MSPLKGTFLLLVSFLGCALAIPLEDGYEHVHAKRCTNNQCQVSRFDLEAESEPDFWVNKAEASLQQHLDAAVMMGTAKNVIMFLGDGMSVPTVAASRIYKGQLEGNPGEEAELAFDKFPVVGLSRTYCVDRQVADSACSATAYLCGVKANDGTIGVNAKVKYGNCEQMSDNTTHVFSLAKKFMDDGRSAGLVTTTRVTHASPAGVYAHIAHRDWESDTVVKNHSADHSKCKDIAYQLVNGEVGKRLQVILGGGRRMFRNISAIDEEGSRGSRSDGLDLIDTWQKMRTSEGKKHQYVWNKQGLLTVQENTDYLLGLFEADHCLYNLETNRTTEPTLEEMTQAAIEILSKNEKGYFLFVEGGRIDHAHHGSRAWMALDETVEFSKAIAKAVALTNITDTLIVVTSDHAHAMTFNGYPKRGNSIVGVVEEPADDDKPYMTLSYANGPGYLPENETGRQDPTKLPLYGKFNLLHPSMVPLDSETHGGDDVGVYARGPWHHLFTGVYEQSTIPHLIQYAACLDANKTVCSGAETIAKTSGVAAVASLLASATAWLTGRAH